MTLKSRGPFALYCVSLYGVSRKQLGKESLSTASSFQTCEMEDGMVLTFQGLIYIVIQHDII